MAREKAKGSRKSPTKQTNPNGSDDTNISSWGLDRLHEAQIDTRIKVDALTTHLTEIRSAMKAKLEAYGLSIVETNGTPTNGASRRGRRQTSARAAVPTSGAKTRTRVTSADRASDVLEAMRLAEANAKPSAALKTDLLKMSPAKLADAPFTATLRKLVQDGTIKQVGQKRGTRYYL